AGELGVTNFKIRDTEKALAARLKDKHNVEIITTSPLDGTQHSFDAETGGLALASRLTEGQRAFRMASELSFLEVGELRAELTDAEPFTSEASLNLARRGIASYFAAATLMPYDKFHTEAEQCGYDIEYLCQVFGVGYETVASRLSTLQRPNQRGIPFTFVRVDRAGNMSKRHSGTGVHFSNSGGTRPLWNVYETFAQPGVIVLQLARMREDRAGMMSMPQSAPVVHSSNSGGTCPLWNVYETFAQPGVLTRQLAQMLDGRYYLWIARAIRHPQGQFHDTTKMFSVGLGCEA